MSFFRTFLMTGLPFGFVMGTFFSFQYGWQLGLVSGFAGGIFFGIMMAAFVAYQAKQFTENRPIAIDEQLIKEGGANHFMNREGVGGWIYLTDSRFYFKSHDLNIQNHEFIVNLNEIADAEKTNSLGVIPNGLKLTLKNQTVEKFVVTGAKSWEKAIKELI
jgi:GRAM domain